MWSCPGYWICSSLRSFYEFSSGYFLRSMSVGSARPAIFHPMWTHLVHSGLAPACIEIQSAVHAAHRAREAAFRAGREGVLAAEGPPLAIATHMGGKLPEMISSRLGGSATFPRIPRSRCGHRHPCQLSHLSRRTPAPPHLSTPPAILWTRSFRHRSCRSS